MIARFVTLSTAVVLVVGCGARGNAIAFAQEQAPAPAEAPATNASGSSTPLSSTSGSGDLPTPAGPAAAETAPAPAVATVAVDPRDYRIGPEDVLDIQVWKNPDLSRDRVQVRPDGKVSLPLVNDIEVAGLTAEQLRAQLTQRLVKFLEAPEVSVMVREVHSIKVSVHGNVNMAGQYEVRSEATVLDMISRAQGFNTFADKGSIWVIRRAGGKEERLKFDYGDATQGKPGANFFVKPGDVIIVN
jgi:polysaccharide export outer membrane protein